MTAALAEPRDTQDVAAEPVLQRIGYHPGEKLPARWGAWEALDHLSTWAWNPPRRQREDLRYRETKLSMARDGQVEPVVLWRPADATNGPHLVDGNRRLRAGQELGWSHIWAVTLPSDKDPALFTAIRNMKQRTWTTNELMALAVHDPRVIETLTPAQRVLYERLHREVSHEDALTFAERYAMHSVKEVRRLADYSGATMGQVVRYALDNPEGIIRKMREATLLRIPPERLRHCIVDGIPYEEWWQA
jgi:ParB/Sulfiredoxin domain